MFFFRVFPAQAGVFLSVSPFVLSRICLPRASGGVSKVSGVLSDDRTVFPAQAGVFPQHLFSKVPATGLPRASGGVSRSASRGGEAPGSSPRKRGCFRVKGRPVVKVEVFPAQAGVFPISWLNQPLSLGLPRASGGVSFISRNSVRTKVSSPRKRGCFHARSRLNRRNSVFPAQAGVFPEQKLCTASNWGLPRASGGVSDGTTFGEGQAVGLPRASGGVSASHEVRRPKRQSSPRKRGCFSPLQVAKAVDFVFPAQAGVFPLFNVGRAPNSCLPRASGGVSVITIRNKANSESSPRKRGCFFASNLIGVIPIRLPRASGGVSARRFFRSRLRRSSPRKRGCFCTCGPYVSAGSVFPAQAGVFPDSITRPPRAGCLPRASGGVSGSRKGAPASAASSPRKRGCFSSLDTASGGDFVFPAQAGVFRAPRRRSELPAESSPRKRGCFHLGRGRSERCRVFPAQAGVFPSTPSCAATWLRLPRASGGVSHLPFGRHGCIASSPRKRGCFQRRHNRP